MLVGTRMTFAMMTKVTPSENMSHGISCIASP